MALLDSSHKSANHALVILHRFQCKNNGTQFEKTAENVKNMQILSRLIEFFKTLSLHSEVGKMAQDARIEQSKL